MRVDQASAGFEVQPDELLFLKVFVFRALSYELKISRVVDFRVCLFGQGFDFVEFDELVVSKEDE